MRNLHYHLLKNWKKIKTAVRRFGLVLSRRQKEFWIAAGFIAVIAVFLPVVQKKYFTDGASEAAGYLAQLPRAEKILVWSDNPRVCDKFPGVCRSSSDLANGNEYDYYVLTESKKNNTAESTPDDSPIKFGKLYDLAETEYSLEVRGGKISILNARNIPDEYFNIPPFTFAIIGDTQNFSSSLVKSSFPETVENIRRFKPNLTLALGDYVYDCTTPENCASYYAKWLNTLGDLKNNFYPAIGNHDYHIDKAATTEPRENKGEEKSNQEDVGEKKTRRIWEDTFETPANGPKELNETTYSFDYGNSHFVVLNTEEEKLESDLGNFIDPLQESWLTEDLEKNHGKNIFMLFHKPFFPVSKMDNGQQRLWRIIEKYKITSIFTGHVHIFCQRVADPSMTSILTSPVPHFIIGNTDSIAHDTPASCRTAPDAFTTPLKHFAIVEINRNKINVSLYHAISGKILHSYSFANKNYFRN